MSACAQTVDLVPINEQAVSDGRASAHLLHLLPGSAVNVVMPSGENVSGWLSIDEYAAPDAPDGNASLVASGPRTKFVCHGRFVAGHGTLTCRAMDGAEYQLQL